MPIKFNLPDQSPQGKKRLANANGNDVVKTGVPTGSNFPASVIAHTSVNKSAQIASSGANTTFTQPMFFSPLHTPMNWQIPAKRRESAQWSFISPCLLTNYDDFSLIDISELDDKTQNIQNGFGGCSHIDRFLQRQVKKDANKIKVMGTSEPLLVTHDHNCMVIKRKDILCTENGLPGPDLLMSKVAKQLCPWQFENKNQEKLKGMYQWYKQAKKGCGTLSPVVVCKRNTQDPLVIISFDDFIDLIK